MGMTTKRRTPKKNHPWKNNAAFHGPKDDHAGYLFEMKMDMIKRTMSKPKGPTMGRSLR